MTKRPLEDTVKEVSKKSLLILLFLFLALLVATIIFFLTQKVRFFERLVSSSPLSLENSYLFASPLVAKADGEEKITISAFVLSDKGLGIAQKKVILYSAPILQAKPVRELTDPRGLAVFEVSSLTAGQYNLWAVVESGGQIKQQVNVQFENF